VRLSKRKQALKDAETLSNRYTSINDKGPTFSMYLNEDADKNLAISDKLLGEDHGRFGNRQKRLTTYYYILLQEKKRKELEAQELLNKSNDQSEDIEEEVEDVEEPDDTQDPKVEAEFNKRIAALQKSLADKQAKLKILQAELNAEKEEEENEDEEVTNNMYNIFDFMAGKSDESNWKPLYNIPGTPTEYYGKDTTLKKKAEKKTKEKIIKRIGMWL